MILRNWRGVLDGTVTQARWPVKEGEFPFTVGGFIIRYFAIKQPPIWEVCDHIGRTKWQVGKTYAVQPGWGQKAVGRIEIARLRRERLQDISEEDAKAEGANLRNLYGMDYIPGWQSLGDDRGFTEEQRVSGLRGAFAQEWDSRYPKKYNWLENPDVWVLEFVSVKDLKGW